MTRRAWLFRCVTPVAACHAPWDRLRPRWTAVLGNSLVTSAPQRRHDPLVPPDGVIQ